MSLSNQNIVNQNYIENETLVSTVDFVFNQRYLGKGLLQPYTFDNRTLPKVKKV